MKFMNFSLPEQPSSIHAGCTLGEEWFDLSTATAGDLLGIPRLSLLEDALRIKEGLAGLEAKILKLERERRDQLDRLRVDSSRARLRAPLIHPQKVIGIGLNYRDHARELNLPIPAQPILFAMYANAIIGPDEPIVIPAVSTQVDYEAELGVVIGRRGRDIPESEALDYVAGYTVR